MTKYLPLLALVVSLQNANAFPPDFDRPTHEHHGGTIVIGPGFNENLTKIGSNQWLALDIQAPPVVMTGTAPFGLRLRAMPLKTNQYYITVEGILEGRRVGGRGIFDVTDAYGAGLSVQIPLYTWGKNAVLLSTGVDVVLARHGEEENWFSGGKPKTDVLYIDPTAQLSVMHEFAPHLALEGGVNGGPEISLGGIDGRGHETKGEVSPLVRLFVGVRF